MENSIVLREETHQKSDDAVYASKSLGSLVQINSIAIDITSAVQETDHSPTHEHFSIRGFVAGMRKKNRKTCLPFASECNDAELADDLPPLVVPKFQWWQCPNCIPDIINRKRSTEETVLIADRSDVGTSSCQNVAEKRDSFLCNKENIGSKDKAANRCAMPEPMREKRKNVSVEEQENASAGKDGADFSAFPNRRKPKLRFLADIMVEERNYSASDNPKSRSSEKRAILEDGAEVSRSPQSKRKMVVLEDEEEERGNINVVAKKTRSVILHAERKCRRVRNSESESEKDAPPVRLDLQKRNKGLDISKKVRRNGSEGRTTVSVSRDEIERICNVSKGKMAEDEANRVRLVPTGNGIVGDRSTKEKVGLDLSLNSFMDADINNENRASFVQFRGIPDLNEEFPPRNFPAHKPFDAFASCSKEATREGKRQLGVYELQNTDNSMEVGKSDDIPMEIVELLARNQHERAHGNSKSHISSEGLINRSSSRGYSGLFTEHRPGIINFPLASRNSSTVGVRQNINPLNLAQFNNNSQLMEMNKPEERQFGFFTSRQQQIKTHYSASVPKHSTGGADLLWPPTIENVPFHLSIPPKHPVQTNRTSVRPYSDQCYRGKTVTDHHTKAVREGRMASTSASVRSNSDHYSNDTIPAMQLLSLMDQRIVSGGRSFEMGPKRIFLDKPFYSSNSNQRQINGKENHSFIGGVYCSGESSKKASSYVLGQSSSEMGKSKATTLEGLVIRTARNNLLQLGPCTLNRNPADFSIPDSRNEFTISAKDLKFRKRNATKEKLRLLNVEKRGRMRKDDSMKLKSIARENDYGH